MAVAHLLRFDRPARIASSVSLPLAVEQTRFEDERFRPRAAEDDQVGGLTGSRRGRGQPSRRAGLVVTVLIACSSVHPERQKVSQPDLQPLV